jgi:2-polyprenyl-3-methyl-5-hydroxy-6-metoxy-1,4-benzoquinol methylase
MTTTTATDASADTFTVREPDDDDERVAGSLAERFFGEALGAIDMFTAYLGLRLGLYQDLADHPGTTAPALAHRTGIAPRYAREWLEQQTVTGIVSCDDRRAGEDERTFRLPRGHAVALLDAEHPTHVGALALACAGIAGVLPRLLDAYRTGGGVPYAAYGADFRDGQAGFNRPTFVHQLTSSWLTAFPDLHARLTAGEPVPIADVACGAGWSTIEMAKAFPRALLVGFDLDDASIADARRNAAAVGVADRVVFEVHDGADLATGSFDLVTVFEAIHDLSQPVAVLSALRRLRSPGGHVLVVDERTADSFAESEGPVEAFFYGASVLHCLPVGMVDQPSAGTGTVMRASTLHAYATEAGFERVDVLPIDHDLFRLYELV